jgi:hypothetical protein
MEILKMTNNENVSRSTNRLLTISEIFKNIEQNNERQIRKFELNWEIIENELVPNITISFMENKHGTE